MPSIFRLIFALFCSLTLVNCIGSNDTDNSSEETAPEEMSVIGEDQIISVFEAEHVYFGDENRRSVDKEVTFPPTTHLYESVSMTFKLSCPALGGLSSRCDAWDRYGWLAIVENAGAEEEEVIEFWRYITPYGVGGEWTVDMTDLRPLFSGDLTFRVFIDTWVGPGHEAGDGWAVDVSFDMKGGTPENEPIAVVPVWTSHSFVYGDPNVSVDPAAETTLSVPEGATKGTLRVLVTGHGQGNAENCAEFCTKTHTITAGELSRPKLIWRDDCSETAVPNQLGNWEYDRAGWCPGAYVYPWIEDISSAVKSGEDLTIAYRVAPYVNTCRPDSENCEGCVFGTGCDYNGNSHTEPKYVLSGLLTLYK